MYNIDAYIPEINNSAKIKQLTYHRDWMSVPTYSCFPLALANTFGYGIYFDEDISFIWDGNINKGAKATKGSKFVWDQQGRPEGTASIETGIWFKSEQDVSLLTCPVPNHFPEEYGVMSTILSTSFFTGPFSIGLKINHAYINKEIIIPAGEMVACIIPISVSSFQNSNINIHNTGYPFKRIHDTKEYVDTLHQYRKDNDELNLSLYKKGLDHKGNKIGNHEISRITMNVTKIGKDNNINVN